LKKLRNPALAMASVLTLGWAGTQRGKLFLRRMACRLVERALFIRSRNLNLSDFKTVLAVAPHPDDETFGCGGTLALMARSHLSVHVLFVTDGSGSHPGHPVVVPDALAAIRLEEARVATQKLGIDWRRVAFLNEKDGGLGQLMGERRQNVARGISDRLASIRPDAVLLPGRSDGSSEHKAAFALVREAVGQAGFRPRILEFPVWSWWNPLLLAGSIFAPQKIWRLDVLSARTAKADAMACYSSQTKPIPPDTDPALPEGFALMFLGRYEFYIEH
jgi:LmbE family N-acetylglucosaminyl deacetylase